MLSVRSVLLVIAVFAGLFLAYVDLHPNFDDTGILVGLILLISGLLALLGYPRPWLVALLVGAWIPLHDILTTRNFGSILALVFAFVGAYAGWGVRKAFH